MRLCRVVFRELVHRKANSLSALFAVALAVGTVAGSKLLLEAYESHSTQLLSRKEDQLESRLDQVKADVRRAMAELGFNLVILPREQSLADWYSTDYASKTIPEAYVDRLRKVKLVTVSRPLPQLRRAITWPETKWKVILVGRGKAEEAAAAGSSADVANRFVRVPEPGSVFVGHEIHTVLGLNEGDDIKLMGTSLRIARCLPREGNKDDVTIWLTLDEAQGLLREEGRVNEILALGCQTNPDDIDKVRAEIARVLPETQVIQKSSESLAMAMASLKVREKQRAMLARERAARDRLASERRRTAVTLVLAIVLACGIWLAWLAWTNVQERRLEIGVWKASGLSAARLATLFLGRWVTLGTLGACLGIVGGGIAALAIARAAQTVTSTAVTVRTLAPSLIVLALLVTVVLTGTASVVAGLAASRRDPAVILRQG